MGFADTDVMDVATEEDKQHAEIWELTIPGRVSLSVHLPGGVVRTVSRKGEGQRLRVTTYDRKIAQEGVRLTNNDPFRNGALIRVDTAGAKALKSHNELGDKALAEVFELEDDDFTTTLDSLSEVNVRRLRAMTRKAKASAVQADAIEAIIETKWPIGADTPSNKEARGDG